MQRSSLFFAFVFQICWISASTRTCLPGAILEPDRMNITLDGISLPVGIWQSVPGASTVVSHLYAIVLSEKLGFNVHMDIGAASELIIGKLAGCSHEGFAITGDCGPPRRFHVAFEDWITGSEWQKKALVDAEPYGVPVNLGSPGYAGKSGMAVLNGGWRAALADSGLALNFYRSYDASWFDPSKYTADVQMVDLARLKTCENSAELGYPGLAEVYVRATGDLEGVVEVNGTKRLKLGRKLSGDLWDLSRYWLLMEEVRRSLVGLMEHPIPLAQAMGSSMFFMYGANRALRRCCLLQRAAMASF
eukprot:symbB.v1.2.010652.t1/scaffold698.1/size172485/1